MYIIHIYTYLHAAAGHVVRAPRARITVDLWSLDTERSEVAILNARPFGTLEVGMLSNWSSTRGDISRASLCTGCCTSTASSVSAATTRTTMPT